LNISNNRLLTEIHSIPVDARHLPSIIIQNKPLWTHLNDLYRTYSIPKLYQYQVLCIVHRFYYNCNSLADIFSDYFKLNQNIHQSTRLGLAINCTYLESIPRVEQNPSKLRAANYGTIFLKT